MTYYGLAPREYIEQLENEEGEVVDLFPEDTTADRTLDTEVHIFPVIVGLDSHDKGGIGQGDGFNDDALRKGVAGNGVGVCEVLLGEPDHPFQPLRDQCVGLVFNGAIRKAYPEVGQGLLLQVGQFLP